MRLLKEADKTTLGQSLYVGIAREIEHGKDPSDRQENKENRGLSKGTEEFQGVF